MNPIRFEGVNLNYGPPKNWDAEKNGECLTLPVMQTRERGLPLVISVWKPTDEERAAIAAGANIVLSCVGTQPPVMLYVREIDGEVIHFADEKPTPVSIGKSEVPAELRR